MASNADPSPPTRTVFEEWTHSLQDLIIPNSSLLEVSLGNLGSGTYAQTSVTSLNGAKCVSKTVHTFLFAKNEFRKLFIDSSLQLSKLHHPNLVQFLGVQLRDAGSPPSLIFEFHPLNLKSCLQKYPQLPKHEKYAVLLDVARGLQCLHTKSTPIVHGSLSAKNVLLTSSLHAKISDPIRFEAHIPTSTDAPYQPPEGTASTSGDVFCFGDLIIHVLLQKPPSPLENRKHHEDPGETVCLGEVQRRKKYLDALGDGNHTLKDLAEKCLDDDPTLRPTAETLVEELEKIVASSHPEFDNMLDMYLALGQLALSKETIDSLKRTIQGKEVEIEALKQQMEPLNKDLEAKTELIDAQKQEVEAYKQALQGKEARIRAHESGNRAKEALIKAKDREIAAKKLDVAAKESLLRASHKRIEVLEQQVSALRKGGDSVVPLSPASSTSDSKPFSSSVASGDSPLMSPNVTKDDSSAVVLRKSKGRKGRIIMSDGFAYQNAGLQRTKSSNDYDPALANILARQHQRIEEAENLNTIEESKAADVNPQDPSTLRKPKTSNSSPPPVRPKRPRASSMTNVDFQNMLEKRSEN